MKSKTLAYRPDVDGLRAIAVLAVIAFHAFPNLAPGGFIGVDIFFVISGYLISSIIFKDLALNTFSFFDFYSRRIGRIFPSLLVVLASCYIFGWYFFVPNEFEQLGKHIQTGRHLFQILLFGTKLDISTMLQKQNHYCICGLLR
ncbi:MAG: acyltransferase family protein [Bdellovibrio sp.]